MKKLIIKSFDKVIVVLLGIAGVFTNCDKPLEYGTPYADYEIKGVVTNIENAQPIPGIRVIHQNHRDTIYTDAEGKYAFNYERWLFEYFNLKIEDIDGEDNGGDFRTQEIVVKVTEKDKVKAGEGWYAGKYVKIQDIALISKDTAVVIPEYGVRPTIFKP